MVLGYTARPVCTTVVGGKGTLPVSVIRRACGGTNAAPRKPIVAATGSRLAILSVDGASYCSIRRRMSSSVVVSNHRGIYTTCKEHRLRRFLIA